MIVTLAALLVVASPTRAEIPAAVDRDALVQLTRSGEVLYLPRNNTQPFNAVLVSSTAAPCAEVEQAMLDVDSYPRRWNIRRVDVLERSPQRVRYELVLNMRFAPNIPGIVERVAPGRVVFTDPQTQANFVFTQTPNPTGCTIHYSLLEATGKPGGFVAVVRAFERSAADAANVAAAVSSMRGYAHPETQRGTRDSAADGALFALARHGTAMHLRRHPDDAKATPQIVVRRVVKAPFAEIVRRIENRANYPKAIEVIRDVDAEGPNRFEYDISAFGGGVTFQTQCTNTTNRSDMLSIHERVVGGDLRQGDWQWVVRPTPDGTDVMLTWNVDISEGSRVMRSLADFDPMARDAIGLHLALALMSEVVGSEAVAP